MSYVTAIGVANPRFRSRQSDICEFMVNAMKPDERDERRLRAVFRSSGIDYRHSVLPDYGRTRDFEFYPNSPDLEPFPSTADRMRKYRQEALPLSLEAIDQCLTRRGNLSLPSVTHLIVVSCTGMYAPGLDVQLAQTLKLSDSVERTSITFMGCYAAFTALRLAHQLCHANANACALVVCTELCSLHFQREMTDDNLLSNALFGDGSAAFLVEKLPIKGSLKPLAFKQTVLAEGVADMAWTVGNFGFQMKLTPDVPDLIRKSLQPLSLQLKTDARLPPDQKLRYAIHPGGKKILEAIEQELQLNKGQNEHAYGVLKNHGNMSSPTVLFVLQSLAESLHSDDDGASLMSFAFGPGLTLESMILQYIG